MIVSFWALSWKLWGEKYLKQGQIAPSYLTVIPKTVRLQNHLCRDIWLHVWEPLHRHLSYPQVFLPWIELLFFFLLPRLLVSKHLLWQFSLAQIDTTVRAQVKVSTEYKLQKIMEYIVLVAAPLPQFWFSLCSRIISLKQMTSNSENVNSQLLMLISRFYATFFKLIKMCKFIYACICSPMHVSVQTSQSSAMWYWKQEPKSSSVVFEEDIGYQRILYHTGRSPKSSWWAISAFVLSVSDPCWSRKQHNSPEATWGAAWGPTAAHSTSDRALLLTLQPAGCWLPPPW